MSVSSIAHYFDTQASSWDATTPDAAHLTRTTTDVAWAAGVQLGTRVLDVGCGTGVMVPAYLEAGAAEIVGLDVSPNMIELACAKFAGCERVHFACCDVLDFHDTQRFDALVIFNAYPHFLDKAALVEKAAKLLVPHGRFLVAHSVGREAINARHAQVPEGVTSHLDSAADSAAVWSQHFDIDCLVDTPHCYLFGGTLKASIE